MILYRYDEILTTEGVRVYRREFAVIKETPKGYWVETGFSFGGPGRKPDRALGDRWVSRTGRKRFCWPTKQEALESLIQRKQRQQKILNAQLSRASTAEAIAKKMLKQKDPQRWGSMTSTDRLMLELER